MIHSQPPAVIYVIVISNEMNLGYTKYEVIAMCGRYTFFTENELREIDDIIEKVNNEVQRDKMSTGEIFPTNIVPVLLPHKEEITPRLLTWGFPNFKNSGVIINARSETVHEKPMFRSSLASKRCVIPSTGFYEWDKDKNKYLFHLSGSPMLYMAGLYHEFDGLIRFVILTTDANNSMAEVHKRMPIVLPKKRIEDWLFDNNAIHDILYSNHPELIKERIV